MKNPFKVGGHYRNYHDEYEVISLDEPDMVLQYKDGSVLETTVELQARIWRSVQMEEKLAQERKAERRSRSRRRRRRRKFKGLQEQDFQSGVKGTHWRARSGFGGLLAQRMSDDTSYRFQSYAIYNRPELHIARPTYYDKKERERDAKFVFDVDPDRARYGFFIEKKDGPMDETWDWRKFLNTLSNEKSLWKKVEAAMQKLGLHWEVYIGGEDGKMARVKAAEENLVWEWPDKDKLNPVSWPDFVERLQDMDPETWCSLYLCTYLNKQKAISAGTRLVDSVAKVYKALLPLYESSA
jgi:hypothetical protein